MEINIFENEPQNEGAHLVVRLVADQNEELNQADHDLNGFDYYEAIEKLGDILVNYQNDNWNGLDCLSLEIIHWGKNTISLHNEGVERVDEVALRHLGILVEEILINSNGVPFIFPVIYDGVILENDFALEYIKYCVQHPNPIIKIHDLAREILAWSKPVMEFIAAENAYENAHLGDEPSPGNIGNVNVNPLIPNFLGVNNIAFKNVGEGLSEAAKPMAYLQEFRKFRTLQIINKKKVLNVLRLEKLIKDMKAMEIKLLEGIERLKIELANHEQEMSERFAASEKDYLETVGLVKQQLDESEKKLIENAEKLHKAQVQAYNLQSAVNSARAENQELRQQMYRDRRRNESGNGCTIL
ncbi:MAG: hypothetical protein H0W50_07670 [Parachlamydiaceae bacterium]|nr:hypothetical protein [Parachlamydiaceae bacterium]